MPQIVAPTQTLSGQQVSTAQIKPEAQSALFEQVASPAHGVLPSTQYPVSSAVLAHTQSPPGPHGPNVSHVCPVHELLVQAPWAQTPVAH